MFEAKSADCETLFADSFNEFVGHAPCLSFTRVYKSTECREGCMYIQGLNQKQINGNFLFFLAPSASIHHAYQSDHSTSYLYI